MKIKSILAIAASAVFSLAAAQAQITLTAWTFDNSAVGFNSNPSPSTGLGTASALGMGNSFNNTNSVSRPDIQSLAGSSGGGPNSWRIRGFSTLAGQGGNGWSTNAPIGTQGAQFSGSTLGYYQVQVSFDVYDTADAEANLQVQYTTDGSNYLNATITSAGSDVINLNSNPSDLNTVAGSYVQLVSGWNNQIVISLSGIAAVDNNQNFAIRLVNASTGTDCVDTTGAIYNNTSGSWTFDNVKIQGTSIDTVAEWTFESENNNSGNGGIVYTNTIPEIGGATAGQAYSIGFNNSYVYNGGEGIGSVDISDVLTQPGSSSGAAGPNCWRVRGGNNGNGWNSQAPIGTQGAEYDASTAGYSNIVVTFDLYFTTQGEVKMCVLYTTDGWITTNIAQNLSYGSQLSFIHTNTTSANTVAGTYFWETTGQNWYNDMVVDFTGIHAVENNPLFGIRIVNAATGADVLNYLGAPYNNSSGNCRFDNVAISGSAGNTPPVISYDPTATEDGPFTNTFIDNPAWRTNISAIFANGLILTNSAYNTTVPGEIIFTPANSTALQSSGLKNFVILSKSFGTARIAQPIAPGVATQLSIVNPPSGPTASGGTFVQNPFLIVGDRYGNGTTNPYSNVSVSASVGGSRAWTLGGDTNQTSVNGLVLFTNLTATVNGSTAVANAYITFAITGYSPESVTNSGVFNIGAPSVPFSPGNLAVLQVDSVKGNSVLGIADNSTFSIIELNPSVAAQTKPVNTVAISATGTNGLRFSDAGATGRLALSDDGTLICFGAFVDNSAATPDETLNLNREAAGINYDGVVSNGLFYTSITLGGSEARSAVILGDGSGNWIANDKGGLYEGSIGSGILPQPNLNAYNNVVVKSFGGNPWVETQKAVFGASIPVVYMLGFDPDTGLYDVTFANNLTTDANATDFYLVSTNGGNTYDILYINDQNSATQGVIKKYSYSYASGNWNASGSFTNSTSVDALFVTTNGNGGAYLYYTTGNGGVAGNSVVRITDAAGWGANMSVTSSNLLYTAPANASLKGLVFVPQQSPNTAQLIPPPILIAQKTASVTNITFTVTNTPDVPAWRSGITTITVNGSVLPNNAYSTTTAGKIVFTPSQSQSMLQVPGAKTIVIAASGFGQASVVQTLASVPRPVLGSPSVSSGSMTFTFNGATGFSYSVHGTNIVTAPIATWPVIGTATESPAGSGRFQFTDPNPATGSQMFYTITQP